MFLEKSERLLIMDVFPNPKSGHPPPHPVLSIPDMLKLEGVGVKTIYLDNFDFTLPDWKFKIDNILEKTDLKILLPFWYTAPSGSRDWLIGGEINYADADVGKSIDEFTLKFLDQLSYAKGRTQLTYAYRCGGEVIWAVHANWGKHEHQNEMVAEFAVERQKILSSQYNEVWMTAHDVMGGTYHTILVVNDALRAAFPDCEQYRIQHHYFPWINLEWKSAPLRRVPWAKYFVGSQWVDGLESNYWRGMGQGIWGFLTAPVHLEAKETRIEDEMLVKIGNAIEKLSLEPDYSEAWEERPFFDGGPGKEPHYEDHYKV